MDHKGHRKRPAGGKSTLTDRTSGPVPGLGPIRCCIRQWKYLLLQKQRGICGIRVHSSVCACWEKGTESQVGLQIEGFFAIILPNEGERPGVCPPSSWHRVPGEGCLLNMTVTRRTKGLGCLTLLLAIGGLLVFGFWGEPNIPAFARMAQQTLVIDGHRAGCRTRRGGRRRRVHLRATGEPNQPGHRLRTGPAHGVLWGAHCDDPFL